MIIVFKKNNTITRTNNKYDEIYIYILYFSLSPFNFSILLPFDDFLTKQNDQNMAKFSKKLSYLSQKVKISNAKCLDDE